MSDTRTRRLRLLWILPPIAVGALVVMVMAGGRPPPAKTELGEPARVVRTISVPRVDLVPTAEGFGPARPARVWSAVAQVSGRIVDMHPRLRDGEIIAAGTPLLRIDPVDYELAVAQLRAELAELDVQGQNADSLLAIERRNLDLAEREAERLDRLARQGTTSRSDADAAERAVLASRTAVRNLRNTLALLPSQRSAVEARIQQAERDLANTEVEAPFNLRVAALTIENAQYVSTGQVLFDGDDVDRTEVVAQVAMSALRHLFVGRRIDHGNILALSEDIAGFAALRPIVQMDMGGHVAEWQAEFVRFTDSVDTDTRTIGVVVAIDKPFQKARPGLRPPLSKGMFVRVLLRGATQADRLIVPRSALRDGRVLVVDDANRLRTRTVDVLFQQQDIAVIASGVEAGQQVVVSDPVPAVDGMLLQPQPDDALQQRLLRAAGDAP
ncbi:MAG: efflux RND transporter periplasmic adaptor subunit [Gammaproteobacteria bacterium]|nr:efflux RND transporter periplasmic adaptor subunit [Gammaproteobacteria bacterium]